MQAVTNLPDLAWSLKHFSDLLGRRCTGVFPTQKLKSGPADVFYGAWYELDDHRIVGTMAVDMNLAAIFGTALAMVPGAQAQAMAKAGALDPMATDCLFECLNVSSRFFHRAFERPVTIVKTVRSTVKGADAYPEAARTLLARPGQRMDIALTVDGYGTGMIAIACT
ncbi:MAG: hypothetical protein RLZZ299_1813 [Pseudomonadota bacterium]|jgi:hypothetical protein